MVRTDARVRRHHGVTLVEVTVANVDDRSRTVRITSELDGAVWPPRTRGVPERDWDGGETTVRLGPNETRSVGFASPATPADPPVTVTVDRPATDGGGVRSPAAVVRALGDPRPPRDAIPDPGTGIDPHPSDRSDRPGTNTGSGRRPAGGSDPGGPDCRATDGVAPRPPPAVRAWLAAIETGIHHRTTGRPPSGSELPNAGVLRALADRAGDLADRLGSIESDRSSADPAEVGRS